MRTTYTPPAGSLPEQVIGFFTNNPDEELTLDDIISKFGPARGNIHTTLGPAVMAGVLQRKRNADSEYAYSLVTVAVAVLPGVDIDSVHARRPAKPAQVAADAALRGIKPPKPLKTPRANVRLTDPADLVIGNDPLPTFRTAPGNKYADLLTRLKVGQCIKCQPAEVGKVSRALRKWVRDKGLKAAVRTCTNYEPTAPKEPKGRVFLVAAA
jgi:hypothetical protein